MKAWVLAFCLLGVLAKTPEEWKSRTIYQIVTDRFARGNGDYSPCKNLKDYCGGTFKGIQKHLDYIQGMGFDAIWISPILPNTPGSYHGYAAVDFYGINPHFGTEQDFIDLVEACHKRDIWIMLDVVANHVGPVDNYSKINPFDRSEYYHPYCPIQNWNNETEVEWCWLFTLPDLSQEHPYVRRTLISWINWIVSKYKIDGLRVDTAMEVPKDFWVEFTKSSGVYAVGEVFNGDIHFVSKYQGPLSGVLNYPLYFTLKDLFAYDKDMYEARTFMESMKEFPDQKLLASFVDNHDNARFLNIQPNIKRFQNAIAWSLVTNNIPIVYYGDEQSFNGGNDPENREVLWPYLNNTDSTMYKFISEVVSYRKRHQIWNYPWIERYADHHFYCYSMGKAMAAFSNTDEDITREITYHPYEEGEVICDIFWKEDCITVTNGAVEVVLLKGETKLYEPKNP